MGSLFLARAYLFVWQFNFFSSFSLIPQRAARANRHNHGGISLTAVVQISYLMLPFESEDRNRHFKGMIHLILRWVSRIY